MTFRLAMLCRSKGPRLPLLLLAAAWLALAPAAWAQSAEPLPYPPGTTTPWRTPGIDPDELAQSRAALTEAHQALAAAWLDQTQTLTQYVGARRPLTLNARRAAQGLTTGTPKEPLATPAMVVEPTWCSLMDRHVLVVTVADARRNTLLASAHTTVSRSEWRQKLKGRALAPFLTERVTTLARTALGEARQRGDGPPQDALHLGLSLAHHVGRRDEGSSHCLTLLLEEKLAPTLTVARALGADRLALLRQVLGQAEDLRQPTRGLVLEWQKTSQGPPVLPLTLRLVARPLETVFGRSLPVAYEGLWTFKVSGIGAGASGPGERLDFTVDPRLTQLLEGERRGLLLSEWPQVAKVDRAWVYLDRGRAWGLKLNDRLVAQVDGVSVKGHVVRFFGPEAQLVSPRGFPIREGAIVFVRKGQGLTRQGLEFRMDPRTFPTPWPLPAEKAPPGGRGGPGG